MSATHTRVYVRWPLGTLPPGPGEMVGNGRTGELMKVVAVGDGWIDVIRSVPVADTYDPPLWLWLLAATGALGVMQFTSSLTLTLVLFGFQIGCLVLVVRGIRRWLAERTDW